MAIEFSSVELTRLSREDEWDATSLAQELQSLLPNLLRDIPAARLVAKATDKFPSPIDITDFTTGQDAPFATFRRGSNTFSFSVNQEGNLTVNGQPTIGGGGGSGAASSFPGVIVAYLGANLYTVTIYRAGTTGPGTNVVVLQTEGDPAFPHAVGRSATVTKSGSQYSMCLPTWG